MKVVATSGAFQRQLPAAQGLHVALPKTAVFEGHERLQPVGELHIVTGVREVALSQIPRTLKSLSYRRRTTEGSSGAVVRGNYRGSQIQRGHVPSRRVLRRHGR